MDKNLDRRDLAKRTSAAFGGLLAGAIFGGRHSAGENRGKSDNRLVLLGLNALARAHKSDYFADGHRGASMIAAHCLCVENNLDEQARTRIAKLFDLNWASSAPCEPFPDAAPQPAGIAKIGAALAEGGQDGCQGRRVPTGGPLFSAHPTALNSIPPWCCLPAVSFPPFRPIFRKVSDGMTIRLTGLTQLLASRL